jgi:CO/xanthine dehydrogenase FAD-binding subunit
MSYHRPLTLIDALQLLTADNAKLLAGGTDFYPALGNKCPRGDIVDITAIPALRGISEQADDIRFGAATTWTDIARATLPPFCNALQQAALEVGARQIQNAGTLGGNLCNASPAADSVPVLLALNARVELCSAQGVRQLPLSEFILGVRHTALANNELLSAIVIPKPDAETHSAFLKLGSRHSLVISIAMIAVVMQRKENRIKQAAI